MVFEEGYYDLPKEKRKNLCEKIAEKYYEKKEVKKDEKELAVLILL